MAFRSALNVLGLPFWLSRRLLAAGRRALSAACRRSALSCSALKRKGWGVDRVFDQPCSGAAQGGRPRFTRLLQHGRLEIYLVTMFAGPRAGPRDAAPVVGRPGRAWRFAELTPYEWGALGLVVVGVVCVVAARSRLFAIVALGIQGLALALIFIVFGAPDLGFTQLLIEVLSVVIVALVMTRLHLSVRDPRPFEDWLRDGALALICGGGLAALLVRVVQFPLRRPARPNSSRASQRRSPTATTSSTSSWSTSAASTRWAKSRS